LLTEMHDLSERKKAPFAVTHTHTISRCRSFSFFPSFTTPFFSLSLSLSLSLPSHRFSATANIQSIYNTYTYVYICIDTARKGSFLAAAAVQKLKCKQPTIAICTSMPLTANTRLAAAAAANCKSLRTHLATSQL